MTRLTSAVVFLGARLSLDRHCIGLVCNGLGEVSVWDGYFTPKYDAGDVWRCYGIEGRCRGGDPGTCAKNRVNTSLACGECRLETVQTSRSSAQEIDTRFSLGCESTNLSVERLDKDKDTDENVDAHRVRTGRPVGGHKSPQLEEIDIDFRVSGLPHAVVKQAENFRVRELVKKIESHPHREALQADLQQNNAYNPFSEKSKKMIREMGNVGRFELCETIPKVQCSECLLYWNQGILYCTCEHLLREK